LRALDKLLLATSGESGERRNQAAVLEWQGALTGIDQRLAAIDLSLARDYPEYTDLAYPVPITIAEAQALLSDSEALVLFLDSAGGGPKSAEQTFVWVVTKNEARWVSAPIGTVGLRREVAALRCGLDASAWEGAGIDRCLQLLKLGSAPGSNETLPFDVARARALYRALFGEIEPT